MSTAHQTANDDGSPLAAATAAVKEVLRSRTARPADGGAFAADPLPPLAALDALARALGLSPFERDLLLFLAVVETDPEAAALCAELSHRQQPLVTVQLALSLLAHPHWSALAPSAALRRFHLVELVAAESLMTSPLRIDERIVCHLLGVSTLDERLLGMVAFATPPAVIPESQLPAVESIVALWRSTEPPPAVVLLSGADVHSRSAAAAAAARSFGLRLLVVRAADLPGAVAEREKLARLLERELLLEARALLIDADEHDGHEVQANLAAFVDRFAGPLVVSVSDTVRLGRRAAVRVELPRSTTDEQRHLWQWALGVDADDGAALTERVMAHFDVGPDAAQAISRAVRTAGEVNADGLWKACRIHLRAPLDDLARRIDAVAGWEDLVLPASEIEILRIIAAHLRQRRRVIEDWGFAEQGARGLGSSALFWGQSGTGKTMAAEVLARELQLDLYHIDLSQVVSKYIGETERNLRRVFDAAERAGAILLFDEADALFGRRSEVKDSHDRYANIEVSYLLQRMEAYRGLAILTTNMKEAIEPAFLRRLRFVVRFPFPDPRQRAEIWRRVLPAATPTEGLDVSKLARLQITGGSIRNIALGAAFLAAGDGTSVRMNHLARAARAEFAKLEKTLVEAELAHWG
jgi:hypothetical protein